VKFLPENNLQFQTVSEADEQRLLEAAPPHLRELIRFATNKRHHAVRAQQSRDEGARGSHVAYL